MSRHLAIFLPSLDGGGAEKVMLLLSDRFVARGIRCDVVVVRNEGALRDRVPVGVNLIALEKSKPIYAVPALVSYLRQARPGALLSTVFSANIAALLAGKLACTQRIVIREANHVSIDVKASSPLSTWLNKFATRLLYRRADAAIAVAQSVKKSLCEGNYIAQDRIHFIANPADLPTNAASPKSKHKANKTIVACGRLEHQKDYPTMLRAFAQLLLHSEAHLHIFGEGSLRTELEGLAKQLGVQNNVTFAGFSLDVRSYMREADALVHTARFEGMSNVILEALAAGCPIVATDCPGGVAEALDNGRYGTLVPVGDATAIAQALEQVLNGTVTFPDKKEYLKRFDPERVADEYLSILFPE